MDEWYWTFKLATDDDQLNRLVFEALGAASTCWENLSGTGVFQETRCKEIGEILVRDLKNLFYPGNG